MVVGVFRRVPSVAHVTMLLGPVFRHEMLAAGRKRRYLVLRVVLGALLLAMLAIAHGVVTNLYDQESTGGLSIAASSQLASQFYQSFAWFTLLGAIGVTPAIAAGAIASERERRTIEYLFATDLSNAEIVVDKLAARLLTVVALALAALPLLAIFRLLGGVPAELVLIHFAQLMTTTAMIAAISLVVSTWTERGRDAVPRAYLTVLVTLIAPGVLWFINFRIGSSALLLTGWITGPLEYAFRIINPIWTLGESGGLSSGVLGVDLNITAMLTSMASQLGVSALCLAGCASAVRRVHLTASSQGDVKEKASVARKRPAPSEHDPMLWKERFASRQLKRGRLSQTTAVGLVVFALGLASLWALREAARRDSWEDYFYFISVVIGFLGPIVALLAGSRAAGLITYEKERETWQSLLTTPLSNREIVGAKMRGNLLVFVGPMAGIVAVVALGLLVNPETWLAPLGVGLSVGVTSWAASAIGLWFSLVFKSSVKAIGATIATLVGLGGGYLPFLMMFIAMAGVGNEAVTLVFAPCVPFLCLLPIMMQYETNGPAEIFVAYVIGCLGYTALAIVVSASATHRFDELCGRGAGGWEPQPNSVEA